jgi:phage-related protein
MTWPTCNDCAYFRANNPQADPTRECHRFPPMVQLQIETELVSVPDATDVENKAHLIPHRTVTKFVAYPTPQPEWLACGEFAPGPATKKINLMKSDRSTRRT